MQRDNNYIAVKFTPNIPANTCDRIITSQLGNNVEKKGDFAPGSSNSRFVIIKLKDNVSQADADILKSRLIVKA